MKKEIITLSGNFITSNLSHSLPETRHLPSAEDVAESNISSTRQSYNLPSAYRKTLGNKTTLGKDLLCRVPVYRHSANLPLPSATRAALGTQPHGTLHTLAAPVAYHGRYCLPSARKGTLGKHLFTECHAAGTRQRLSRHAAVTHCHERYRYRLPSAKLWHSAKIY